MVGVRAPARLWPSTAPLRRRDFALAWWSRTVAFVGSRIAAAAVPTQIVLLTGSPAALGTVAAIQLGVALATAPIGGWLADRLDRRHVVIATEAGFLVGSAALLANSLATHPSVGVIAGVAAALAACDAIHRPSLDAYLPTLVSTDEVPAAAAWRGLQLAVGTAIGPLLGGWLVVTAGPSALYGIDLVTFAIGLVGLVLMRTGGRVAVSTTPGAGPLRFLRRDRPDLLGLFTVEVLMIVFVVPAAVLPLAAVELGHAGALPLVLAAPAWGGIMGALAIGRHGVGGQARAARPVALVALVASLAAAVLAGSPAVLVALALLGASDAAVRVARSAAWNVGIPPRIRGRLASLEYLGGATGPHAATVAIGFLAAAVGIRMAVGVWAVIGLVLVLSLSVRRRPGRGTGDG